MRLRVTLLALLLVPFVYGFPIEVKVNSPFPTDYMVLDDHVELKIFVDYTAPNACYGLDVQVEPERCPDCYLVRIVEKTPPPGAVCAQVIRHIPVVTAELPLPRETNVLHVRVEMGGSTPAVGPSLRCIALGVKMEKIREELMQCAKDRQCDDLERELRRISKMYDANCAGAAALPSPKPSEIPIKPPVVELPKIPAKLDINGDALVAEGQNVTVRIRTDIAPTNGGFVSVKSGKPVDLNVDAIIARIRESIRHVAKIINAELVDTGMGPRYVVKVEEEKRLLWVIPVRIRANVVVDASTGEIVDVKKPWWAFIFGG